MRRWPARSTLSWSTHGYPWLRPGRKPPRCCNGVRTGAVAGYASQPTSTPPRIARATAINIYTDWSLSGWAVTAGNIAAELVHNAIEHAGTAATRYRVTRHAHGKSVYAILASPGY